MLNGRMNSDIGLGRVNRDTAPAAIPFSWSEGENHEISQKIHPPGQNSKPRTLKTKQ
jgi:hypothetical protein